MLHGSYVALITPFQDGQIDEEALRKIVNWHVSKGTHGLVPVGTTGEASTVTKQEHKRIIQIVVEESAGRLPVIAGAGSNNPVESVCYAKSAERYGADAVLSVAGYYNRPSQQGLFEHFKFVHDNTDIPLIVYNIPPRTIVDIEPDTMAAIAELPRVIGVKDATMDLSRVSVERRLISKEFSYFSGEDLTAVAYNAMGGSGCISVTANVAPQLCAEMQQACAEGNYAQALALHDKLLPLHQVLFSEPNPSGIKYATSLLGLCSDEVRLPMISLRKESKESIRLVLEQLGLINN